MNYVFLLNSFSRSYKAYKLKNKIENKMDETNLEYEVIMVDNKDESEQISKKKLQDGFECIVAVGGDGTLQHLIPSIIENDGILGILPAGTANDFIRTLGWSENFDENMDRIIKGNVQSVDLGLADGNVFINTASVGFDADVIKLSNKLKPHIRSKLAYYLSVLGTFVKYKKTDIEFEESEGIKENFLFAVTNGKYYGGGFRISPKSKVDDGYLDLIVANNISKIKVLTILPSFFTGKHIYKKEIQYKRIKKYSIKPKEDFLLNLDGELLEYAKDTIINFDIVEGGLRIIN